VLDIGEVNIVKKKIFTWLALALLALWVIVATRGDSLWTTAVGIFVLPIIILMAWFDVRERSKKRYALILTLIVFWVTILIGERVQWIASVRIAMPILIIVLTLDEDRERKEKEIVKNKEEVERIAENNDENSSD